MVKVLDLGLCGCGFNLHTGHGSLLKPRQFHSPNENWDAGSYWDHS